MNHRTVHEQPWGVQMATERELRWPSNDTFISFLACLAQYAAVRPSRVRLELVRLPTGTSKHVDQRLQYTIT